MPEPKRCDLQASQGTRNRAINPPLSRSPGTAATSWQPPLHLGLIPTETEEPRDLLLHVRTGEGIGVFGRALWPGSCLVTGQECPSYKCDTYLLAGPGMSGGLYIGPSQVQGETPDQAAGRTLPRSPHHIPSFMAAGAIRAPPLPSSLAPSSSLMRACPTTNRRSKDLRASHAIW